METNSLILRSLKWKAMKQRSCPWSAFCQLWLQIICWKLKKWGLELNRHKIIVNSKRETSVAGIYAAGDCCSYDGKGDLIATGLGKLPTAINNAMNYIYPDQKYSQNIRPVFKKQNLKFSKERFKFFICVFHAIHFFSASSFNEIEFSTLSAPSLPIE